MIKHLTALGVAFTRQQVRITPDRLPAALRAQLSGLPEGEPFIIPESDFVSVSVIVARRLPPGSVMLAPRGRAAPTFREV